MQFIVTLSRYGQILLLCHKFNGWLHKFKDLWLAKIWAAPLEWASDQRELPLWTYDEPFLMRDASWLQGWGGKMMKTYGISKVNIIDVRPADEFSIVHVPYAINIPSAEFKSNINNSNKMAAVLGSAGVDASQEAVIISGGGLTKEAALAFVMLEKLGQKKTSLFMDHADKWAQLGFAIIKDTIATNASKIHKEVSKSKATYSVNLRNDVIVSDSKSKQGIYPKVFIASGKNMPAHTQDGKIVHVPYTDLLNTDGIPKAAKEIWNVFTKAGIPRYAELVCISDDPGEAAVNYFIFKLMGYPDIKVLVNQ